MQIIDLIRDQVRDLNERFRRGLKMEPIDLEVVKARRAGTERIVRAGEEEGLKLSAWMKQDLADIDALLAEVERLTAEGKRDYDGMREFQAKMRMKLILRFDEARRQVKFGGSMLVIDTRKYVNDFAGTISVEPLRTNLESAASYFEVKPPWAE